MQAFKASKDTVAGVSFTPDGRSLVVSSYPYPIIWDVTGAPQRVRQFQTLSYGNMGVVSPCGQFLACNGSEMSIFTLTTSKEEPVASLDNGWSHLAFSPDGTELAKAAIPPKRWAVPSWKVVRDDPLPATQPPPGSPFCTGAIAYTPDSRLIGVSFAVMNSEGTRYDSCVRLFDRGSAEVAGDLRMPFGHAHPTQIAFSPDGEVVAGNFGPVLGVVSVADGKQVSRIKVGTKHITSLAFTPDGSKLVTVSNDTRVRVYDARTWTETSGYEWKIGKLRCVAVAPDGLRMAAGSDRGKVVIWDVDG